MTDIAPTPAQEAFLADVAANRTTPLRPSPFRDDDAAREYFNQNTAVVLVGDSFRVIVEQGKKHRLLSVAEAKNHFANVKVVVPLPPDNTTVKPAFPRWLADPFRRAYDDYGFYPGETPAGLYNTFTGWAVEPAPGDFSLLEEHIYDNICRGRSADAAYLMDWSADIFQNTLVKPGVAVGLKGEMGTGKSTFSDCLGYLIGDAYSPVVDRPRQLTGQFNGQIEHAILIRSEEGLYANDPEQRGIFKHLVSAPTMMVERKGINARQVPNYSRLIVTTNLERGVPASFGGERRLFVLEVGDKRKQDIEFFHRLGQQMEGGGYAALMHALLQRSYRAEMLKRAPKTDALVRQILEGLAPDLSWWLTVLVEGKFPVRGDDYSGGDREPRFEPGVRALIPKDIVYRSYRSYVQGYRGAEINPVSIGMFLTRHAKGLRQPRQSGGDNTRGFDFPAIEVLRKQFCEDIGGSVDFDDLACEVRAANDSATLRRRG